MASNSQRRKVRTLNEQTLAYRAEHLAKVMSKELHGSEGLWELFLVDAYRTVVAQDKAP